MGSLKDNDMKPLGIRWPSEPIKALGVFFTYDQRLLYEKNFQEKIDSMKKLTNIWSSRGLSVYGKVAIIKSRLISKLVYTSSLLPTPSQIIKKVNHIIYNFLWSGKDKVTRLSAINNYEAGGIKMIDVDNLIKALRLAWLKRIFSNNSATWKTYFMFLLKELGGPLIFSCNYNIDYLSITSLFYKELLQWWSQFRNDFADQKDWSSVIWNNKDIRINGKPVFYKKFFDFGIYSVRDLLFNLSNIESYNVISKELNKVNFLTWTGHAIPLSLKKICGPTKGDPIFKHNGNIFDITKNKAKDYYSLIVSNKAQIPNHAHKLKRDFKLSEDDLKLVYNLPHTVALQCVAINTVSDHNVNQMSKSMITIDTFITSPFSNDGELMGIFKS